MYAFHLYIVQFIQVRSDAMLCEQAITVLLFLDTAVHKNLPGFFCVSVLVLFEQ